MPTPIPDWDLARRMVKYIGTRQVNGQTTTLRIASRTLGIGRERMERILVENNVMGIIKTVGVKPSGDDLIYLQQIPANLAADAEISAVDLERSYQEIINGVQPARVVRQRRMNKRQLQNQQVKDFWKRKKESVE